MSIRRLLTIIVTFVILVGWGSVSAQSPTGSPRELVGVWLISETVVTTTDGTTRNENPQPGLYIFTERHFSNMLIPREQRAPLSAEGTDQERLAAFENFIADAGTYESTDSEITVHNIIAKIPNVMPPFRAGADLTYGYKFEGESLMLTLRGWDGRKVVRSPIGLNELSRTLRMG